MKKLEKNNWLLLPKETREGIIKLWANYESSIKDDYVNRPFWIERTREIENIFGKENLEMPDPNEEDIHVPLAKLLKGHEGEEFWNPLLGNIKLLSIDSGDIKFSWGEGIFAVNHEGKDINGVLQVFPSQDEKDWENWITPKYRLYFVLQENGEIVGENSYELRDLKKVEEIVETIKNILS